jgi:hypothetical protein
MMFQERMPQACWFSRPRRNALRVIGARTYVCITKFAMTRASSPGRRGDRSPEFGCDVVEVVLSFALNLTDVTRF